MERDLIRRAFEKISAAGNLHNTLAAVNDFRLGLRGIKPGSTSQIAAPQLNRWAISFDGKRHRKLVEKRFIKNRVQGS